MVRDCTCMAQTDPRRMPECKPTPQCEIRAKIAIRWGPVPPPGSDEAVKQGCKCPVLDNAHGKGVLGLARDWWITEGCKVHPTAEADTPRWNP